MQANIWKIIHLNCGERYVNIDDHHIYTQLDLYFPVTEYACLVFHNELPANLSAELEQLQKRAMRIIFPFVSYSDALHQASLETLSWRRQSITTKLFDSIPCNSDHKLYELLPPRNNCESNS